MQTVLWPKEVHQIQKAGLDAKAGSSDQLAYLTITRIVAAFIVPGDRLISRIQYRTFAGNNSITNVDHVTVRHPSSGIRDKQHAS